MYGIPVSLSEPPLGNKGLMSQCSVLPYVPPSLVQLGDMFRSRKAGFCQEMGVRSWSGHAYAFLLSFTHPLLHTV